MADKNTHDEFDFQEEDAFGGADEFAQPNAEGADAAASDEQPTGKSKKKRLNATGFGPAKIIQMVKEAPVAYGFGAVIVVVALFMLHTIMTSWSLSSRQHKAEQARSAQSHTQSFGMNVAGQKPIAKFKTVQQKTPVKAASTQHVVTQKNGFHPINNGGYVQMTKQDMKTLLRGFSLAEQKNIRSLSQKMSQLQQQIGGGGKNQHSLKSQVAKLVRQQDVLAGQMESYNKYLAKISQSLTTTQAQLKLLVAERAAHASKLVLRAVVPGRAWLVNGKGATTTVVVGSELDNYGKVMRIDSKSDKVYMSSGYVFS